MRNFWYFLDNRIIIFCLLFVSFYLFKVKISCLRKFFHSNSKPIPIEWMDYWINEWNPCSVEWSRPAVLANAIFVFKIKRKKKHMKNVFTMSSSASYWPTGTWLTLIESVVYWLYIWIVFVYLMEYMIATHSNAGICDAPSCGVNISNRHIDRFNFILFWINFPWVY